MADTTTNSNYPNLNPNSSGNTSAQNAKDAIVGSEVS